MDKLKVKTKDFEKWLNKEHKIIFAFSYGLGSDKKLYINLYNIITVRDHNFIVYEGRNINDAVKIYNKCK